MGVLPGFEQDIFISYSHIDNEPLTEGQRGWIDTFHKALETRLKQVVGVAPAVWRDPEITGNTFFKEEIPEQLKKTAMLIAVVSPPYTTSDWCHRELKIFCEAAEATGGIRVGNKARIFKVIKLPVPRAKYPVELQNLIGYEFFETDPRTGSPHELGTEVAGTPRQNFVNKMDDLAQQIKGLAEALGVRGQSVVKRVAPLSDTCVYLAETTSDLANERDLIRRELEQRGHTVLPDHALPPHAPAFQDAVREQLSRAQLAVHLVGANYGLIPEAASRSIVALQQELSAERGTKGGFPRLIWMPPGLQSSDERQQQFIQFLQNDPGANAGAELLQTSIEELKTTIEDTLRKRQTTAAARPTSPRSGRRRQVYLICDQQDRDAVAPLEECLFGEELDVTLPAFEGEEAQIRADHRETLVMCDAALIYVGRSGEAWLRAQLRELQKAPGYELADGGGGSAREPMVQGIYFGPPETPAKRPVRLHGVTVIQHFGEFTPESLAPFLERVRGLAGRGL